MPWKVWDIEKKAWGPPPEGWSHWSYDPPKDADGQPWTELREVYERKIPMPTEPVSWESTAPFPISQMEEDTTRYDELVRDLLKIEDCRTDQEIRWLNDRGGTGYEIWPPGTLWKIAEETPIPEYNPQWKSTAYWKAECEDFILDESNPVIARINCLVNRLMECHHQYSRFDLVEKGLAMLHDLKFHVHRGQDTIRIFSYENLLRKQLPADKTKDDCDPRSWMWWAHSTTAGFIRQQFADHMEYEEYDMDREFAYVFGLESSPRVKRGESPVHWEGWDPAGPVDWGMYRVKKRRLNGTTNGHASDEEVANQAIYQDSEASDAGDEEDEALYDEEAFEEEDNDRVEDEELENGGPTEDEELENGNPSAAEESEDDGSDLEEISAEVYREASLARESSKARESSSDIEITGSQTLHAFSQVPIDEESEEDGQSRMSEVDGYLDEEVEEGMDYEEEDFFAENAQNYYGPDLRQARNITRDDDEGEETETEENHGDEEDIEAISEAEDDKSVADSDDLQILDEHHTGRPSFEEELNEGPTEYAMQAAEEAEVPMSDVEEVFDEMGRPYAEFDEGLVEEQYSEEEPEPFVPDTVVEDTRSARSEADSEHAEAEAVSTVYESFPPEVSQALPRVQAMVEIDPAIAKDGFSDFAKRALLKTGADQSLNTSTETSGLSSPPSSRQTEDGNDDDEDDQAQSNDDGIAADAEAVEDYQTPADISIDPALMASPSTSGNQRRNSVQTPRTPRVSFTNSVQYSPARPHEITPFRIEHPRTAAGVVVVPNEAESPEAAASGGEEIQETPQ